MANKEIVILGIAHSIMHIYGFAFPPLFLLIMDEFGLSLTKLSLLTAILAILGVLQLPAGYLVDKFGRKRLTILGVLTVCLSMFSSSLAPSFLVLLTMQVAAGIGQSTFHPATYAIISERAPREYLGKSIAYHQFGGFTGTAIGLIAIASLGSLFGWRQAFQIITIPGLVVVALTWKIVRETEEKNPVEHQTETHNTKFKLTFPLLIILLFATIQGIAIGVSIFLPTFLSKVYGQSIALAGILSGIIQIVGCISIMLGGVAADKFKNSVIIVIFQALSALSIFVLAAGTFGIYGLLILLIFMGLVRDFSGPVLTALVSKVSSTQERGRAIGLEFTGFAIGGFLSSPLIGYLSDTIGIRFAFSVCAVFFVFSGLIILPLVRVESRPSSSFSAQKE